MTLDEVREAMAPTCCRNPGPSGEVRGDVIEIGTVHGDLTIRTCSSRCDDEPASALTPFRAGSRCTTPLSRP